MSKTAIEVITSVQRRRRWTAEEKERLVAASLEPDIGVSAVARQAGIHPSQLYGWRRQLCARPQPAANFAAVRIAAEPAPNGIPASGANIVYYATDIDLVQELPAEHAEVLLSGSADVYRQARRW